MNDETQQQIAKSVTVVGCGWLILQGCGGCLAVVIVASVITAVAGFVLRILL